MSRKSMIKPYKKCKKCGMFIVSGTLCEDCKPKTNADRIRQMTDEELAFFLNDVTGCCSDGYICEKCPLNSVGEQCNIFTFEKWLKQEVEKDAGAD